MYSLSLGNCRPPRVVPGARNPPNVAMIIWQYIRYPLLTPPFLYYLRALGILLSLSLISIYKYSRSYYVFSRYYLNYFALFSLYFTLHQHIISRRMNDLEETSLIHRGDTENPFKGRTRVGGKMKRKAMSQLSRTPSRIIRLESRECLLLVSWVRH